MRKRILHILTVIVVLFGSQSCNEYLDVVPDDIATIDIAFNSRANAEKYLFTLYSYMPQHASLSNPGICAGDECWANDVAGKNWAGLKIAKGNQGIVNPLLNYWASYKMFIALRDCNIFLENIDSPKDLEPYERDRWISEVKFLQAYYHFWLLRMYGPVPIVDENVDVSSTVDAVRLPRETVDEVVNHIVALLDEAMPNLPPVIQNKADELGRITQPIAAAVKARVLVTAASPLFNGNSNYPGFVTDDGAEYINSTFDAEKWVKAKEACKVAIDLAHAGGHSLFQYPGSALYNLSDTTILKMSIRGAVSEKWNEEVIWGSSLSRSGWLQNASLPRLDPSVKAEVVERVNSYWSPTLRMAELFYSNNGVPIESDKTYDYSSRYELGQAPEDHAFYVKPGYTTVNLHFNREARFYASLAFDGNIMYGHGRFNDKKGNKDPWVVKAKKGQTAARINTYQYSVTGYWPKKLVHEDDVLGSNYTREVYPWPVFRLSDLYLLYAETLNEVDGPEASYEWIDKVRDRAGLEGVKTSWTNYAKNPAEATTKDGMRKIIHQERLIELAFEGQRFWDLRRWLEASDYMNNDIRGWDTEQKDAEAYYRIKKIDELEFKQRDYLWPISERDLIVNPALDQNPGW
ncbi:RagB/SusD family nutrient uptake outer membrane protein [Puteibacter caeruleilacunae]|nr:RagB/SusD family nutrient uptake outer membrane protein [Puteibacter caeruleilacunae]